MHVCRLEIENVIAKFNFMPIELNDFVGSMMALACNFYSLRVCKYYHKRWKSDRGRRVCQYLGLYACI